MAATIKFKRATAEDWQILNPILQQGEPGFVRGTNKLKIGDGKMPWNELPFVSGESTLTTNLEGDEEDKTPSVKAVNEGLDGMHLSISMDEAFKLTMSLLNKNDEVLSTKTIDLPLEELIVSGQVSDDGNNIILTLKNDETIEFGVANLVNGLAKQEDLDELKENFENQELPKIELALTLGGNEEDKAPSVAAVNEGLGAKADKSQIVNTLEGNEEAKAPSVAAVNVGLSGRVERSTSTIGSFVYARDNNTDVMRKVNSDPNAYAVPIFDGNASLRTNTPNRPIHAANKQYVDDAVASIPQIQEDLALLKDAVEGTLYKETKVAEVSHVSHVPSNALKYASLDKLGGMSEAVITGVNNELDLTGLAGDYYGTVISLSEGNRVSISNDPYAAPYGGTFNINGISGLALDDVVYANVTVEGGTFSGEKVQLELTSSENVFLSIAIPLSSEIGDYFTTATVRGSTDAGYNKHIFDRARFVNIDDPGTPVTFDGFTFTIDVGKSQSVELRHANVSSVRVYGKNLFDISKIVNGGGITKNGDGSLLMKSSTNTVTPYKSSRETATLGYLCPRMEAGKTYRLSFNISQVGEIASTQRKVYLQGSQRVWYTTDGGTNCACEITEADLNGGITFYPNNNEMTIWDIQIEEGTTATDYAPYKEPTEYPIPSEARPAHGVSADLCNYIDFDAKKLIAPLSVQTVQLCEQRGSPIYLTDGEYAVTTGGTDVDLANVLDWDGTIEVEENGRIEFVNENKMAVPVEISYLTRLL